MDVSLKILFVSSEIFPFAKTGGLADVSRSLPKALASLGHDVRSIMPFYGCVSKGGFEIKKLSGNIRNPLSGMIFGFDLFANRSDGLTTYFVQNKKYFSRKELYGTSRGDYADSALRFSFFSKAVLAALENLQFKPDIIHCNDWPTALIPFYLKYKLGDDVFFQDVKSLFTIHNMAYQGVFDKIFMKAIGVPGDLYNMAGAGFYGKINFMKAGIIYADVINTVSRRYASEIMTPEFGCGLEGLLETRENELFGILNGVDYTQWSPENDRYIKVNYGPGSIENKKACKKDLLEHTGLPVHEGRPLIGCVTRLVRQKGMDLLAGIMDELKQMDIGVVVLGTGEDYYNRIFKDLARRYPANVSVHQEFNDELAHKIEAGCDMFVMPSRYEPCGLNQMYSIKYGTIPIVRATGGLDDAIIDIDENRKRSNGFKFTPQTKEALLEAVKRAVSAYEHKGQWRKLMIRAMSYDFSWERSAAEYGRLYRRMLIKKE